MEEPGWLTPSREKYEGTHRRLGQKEKNEKRLFLLTPLLYDPSWVQEGVKPPKCVNIAPQWCPHVTVTHIFTRFVAYTVSQRIQRDCQVARAAPCRVHHHRVRPGRRPTQAAAEDVHTAWMEISDTNCQRGQRLPTLCIDVFRTIERL